MGSESDKESGESEKDSMSDKDSDSTNNTTQSKKLINGTNENDSSNAASKDKEAARKRGRRPKDASENMYA